MKAVIGIDLGTSSFKAAKLDLEQGTISHLIRIAPPEPVSGLKPSRYELAPAELLATIRSMLSELLAQVPDAAGLVICNQMHSVVLTNQHGQPLSNVITWRDRRATESHLGGGESHFEKLTALVSPEEVEQIGHELRVGVPITTLASMHQSGELPNGCFPISLGDFVLSNLCQVEPSTEPTNAAAHGLFHLDRRDWHWNLIARLGLDRLCWPRIRSSGEFVGIAEIDGHQLTCFTPVGDQQSALVGANVQTNELSLNISTGSQVSLLNHHRPTGQFQIRPFFGNLWLSTIVSVPAGRSLNSLVNLLSELGGKADLWDYIMQEVDRVSETDLMVDLSFFPCFTGNRGSISNIHEENLTVGHLFASAFRTMARNYARCAELLSPTPSWARVVFSGGLASRFQRLRHEVLAALDHPPYRICDLEEETLHGLLQLARQWSAQLKE